MILKKLSKIVAAAALVAMGGSFAADEAFAGGIRRVPQGDVFYNLYSNGPATPAQMYVSPLPAPEWVGHTYYTYQPLMPHEWLNPHSRRYVRFSGHLLPVNYTRVEHW